MIREVSKEHGSVVLEAEYTDCVDYLMEAELVEKRIRHFEPKLRGEIREIIDKVITGIVADYDLDEIVAEDDSFWEWFEEQQED